MDQAFEITEAQQAIDEFCWSMQYPPRRGHINLSN